MAGRTDGKRSWVLALVLGVPLGEGCAQPPPCLVAEPLEPGATTVVRVNRRTLGVAALQARIARENPTVRRRLRDRQKLEDYVTEQMELELLLAEALATKLIEAPEVQEKIRAVVIDAMASRLQGDTPKITEAELRRIYEQRRDRYNQPARVRLATIAIKNRAEGERLRSELRKAFSSTRGVRQAQQFTKLGIKRGALPQDIDHPFQDHQTLASHWGEAVAEHMFAAKVGALEIFASPKGTLYLIRKTGHRRTTSKPFDKVRPRLQAELVRLGQRQRYQQAIETLRNKWHPHLDPGGLDALFAAQTDSPEGPTP